MSQKIIIDGYNLIYAIPGLLDSKTHNLEASREKLLAMVVAFARRRKADIIVVFDGVQDEIISLEESIARNVQVRFSPPHKKADTIILELIQAENNPRSCTVVSSDKAVSRGIKYWGSHSLSSEQFLELLHPRKKQAANHDEVKPTMKSSDLEVWRRIFKKK